MKFLTLSFLCLLTVQAAHAGVINVEGASTGGRSAACANAKGVMAPARANAGGYQITGYGPCECSQISSTSWHCSVDVYVEKR